MERSAKLSEDGIYRYTLERRWNTCGPTMAVIGVNPSTADGLIDDPTIRKAVGFGSRLGFGGLLMLNRYAYRATQPKDLWAAKAKGVDIVGPENSITDLLQRLEVCEMVVAAWGRHGLDGQWDFVAALGRELHCLGRNGDGTPCHPLMLPYTTPLVAFKRGV